MSYFPHYLQVTLLEINYKGKKKIFKDLVILWPLTRTQIKTLLNIREHKNIQTPGWRTDSSLPLWPPSPRHRRLRPPRRSLALASRAAERAPSHLCPSPLLAKKGGSHETTNTWCARHFSHWRIQIWGWTGPPRGRPCPWPPCTLLMTPKGLRLLAIPYWTGAACGSGSLKLILAYVTYLHLDVKDASLLLNLLLDGSHGLVKDR